MISKGLIERLYEAATIQRWNDHVRPADLTELDKQAHKAVLAWLLARLEAAEGGGEVDLLQVAEGSIFELLQRVVLTDIKAPLFHTLMERMGAAIQRFTVDALAADLEAIPGGFAERFARHLTEPEYAAGAKRILRAAHYLATRWEYELVHHTAPFLHGVGETRRTIEREIDEHADLVGVRRLRDEGEGRGFVDVCGQLRFQIRWAGTPRIPKTSVLGHEFAVGALSFLFALELGASDARRLWNFYGGLFHDLPEALTRDIVAPVKHSVAGLSEEIERIERAYVREHLLPLIPEALRDEVLHLVERPFDNRVREADSTRRGLTTEEMAELPDDPASAPIDGELVKACDQYAAFVEAALSIEHGIVTRHLKGARQALYERYAGSPVAGVDFGPYVRYFHDGSDA